MIHRVKMLPSGITFDIEGKETILRAGMREGLNLSHSCMNGSCGECQARLVEGELDHCRHHEFFLSPECEQQGWFLSCCCRAKTDLVIELRELHDVSEVLEQDVLTKVSRLEWLRDDVLQLHLRTPRSQVLDFFSGQKVTLTLDDETALTLPLASCPCDGMNLKFHLRRGVSATVDPFIEKLKKNLKIRVTGPTGDFTLDENSQRPLVFLAMNEGFAAIQSLIDHTISIDEDRDMTLFWFSVYPDGHYLSNYCRSWQDALDNFRYQSFDLPPAGEQSLEEAIELLQETHSDFTGSDIYAVMPENDIDRLKTLLLKAGHPEKRFFYDILQFL